MISSDPFNIVVILIVSLAIAIFGAIAGVVDRKPHLHDISNE